MKLSLAVLLLSVAAQAQHETTFTAAQVEATLKMTYPGQDIGHYGSNQQYRKCADVRDDAPKLQDCLSLVVGCRVREIFGPQAQSHFLPVGVPVAKVDDSGRVLPPEPAYVYQSQSNSNGVEPRLRNPQETFEFVKREADAEKAVFARLAQLDRCRGGQGVVTAASYRMVIEHGELEFYSNPRYAAPSEAYQAKLAEFAARGGDCPEGSQSGAAHAPAPAQSPEERAAGLRQKSENISRVDAENVFGASRDPNAPFGDKGVERAGENGAPDNPAPNPAPAPDKPQPDGANASHGDKGVQLTNADFRPELPKRLRRGTQVPSPGSARPRCPSQDDKMGHIRKCQAPASADRPTNAAQADLQECLEQVSKWWDREQARCRAR